jgi:predicted MFS family arabinose efflux permease
MSDGVIRRTLALDRASAWAVGVVGGPRRGRIITLLAGVLALEAADQGTIGAVATQLERSLSISHTELGLLASATALVAAAVTLPLSALADRVPRVPILAASVALWSGAMVVSGASSSYGMLLLSRIALGAVIAAAGPAIASLTGDFFPARERARIFGYVLVGELAGTAAGFMLSGAVAAALGWRAAFWALSVPGFILAWALLRRLPEPARGEQDRPRDEAEAPAGGTRAAPDPEPMGLWAAMRYALGVRTNLLLIIASALGYFFLSGVRTFALVFVRADYGLSQAAATAALSTLVVGALAGVLVGSRLPDRLLARGHRSARIVVAALAYVVAAVIFVPALLLPWLAAALPLYMLGTGALSAANPPLDAARLDVINFRLWGRSEGVRTTLRTLAVASAPLLFGFLADQLGGSLPEDASGAAPLPATAGDGLAETFLIMLVPLAIGGLILLRARATYPRDARAAGVRGADVIEATIPAPPSDHPVSLRAG